MNDNPAPSRTILAVTGEDRAHFLQGLITNDIGKTGNGLLYAALLTPQGKYLADFFVAALGDALVLDVATDLAPALAQRLTMYRLRAKVEITESPLQVAVGTGPAPEGALPDPRHPALGWRAYGTASADDGTNWLALRVAHVIPQTGIELIPEETYILEAGFDRLNGVDFRKGCYVGQEVTARMKHKTDLKKGLVQVEIEEPAPVGTQITANGKAAGQLYSQSGGKAIAYLRYDRARGTDLRAGDARLHWGGDVPE